MTNHAKRKSANRQLSVLQSDWVAFVRTRLLFWCVRWIIGFSVIWAIVSYVPEWSWLWWVGGVVAAISLITLIAGHVVLQRKFARVQEPIDLPITQEVGFADHAMPAPISKSGLPLELQPHWEQINSLKQAVDSAKLPVVTLSDESQDPADHASSRLGGLPVWPVGANPAEFFAEPLPFLAQLNFAELPQLEGFPLNGLLQIYVAPSALMHGSYPLTAPEGFRTVFHDHVNNLVTYDPYKAGLPSEPLFNDVDRYRSGQRLLGTAYQMRPTMQDRLVAERFEAFVDYPGVSVDHMYGELCDAIWDRQSDVIDGDVLYMGGYPTFMQYDFRSVHKRWMSYDVCLVGLYDHPELALGSCAISVLMTRQALAERNFDAAILYLDTD